jgi:phytoene dehydrogenase-like protein
MGKKWDVIVIGSGMGALSAASILAQMNKKRVLVIERHFEIGGLTHAIRRKGYSWDVGLHYVGEMSEGAMVRRIFGIAIVDPSFFSHGRDSHGAGGHRNTMPSKKRSRTACSLLLNGIFPASGNS